MRHFTMLMMGFLSVACSAAGPEIDIETATRAEQQLARVPAALAFIAAGEYGNAIDVLTEISAALPDSSHAANMAAFLGMRDATEYRRVHSSVHNNLGLALFRSRRFDAAVSEYADAAEADTDSAVPHRNLAKVLMHQRRFADALAAISEAERRETASTELSLDKGTIARELGDFQLARSALRQVIDSTSRPDNFKTVDQRAQAHYQLGLLELESGDLEQAVVEFEAALGTNPGFVRGRYHLARTLGLLGATDASLTQVQRFEADSALVASIQGVLIATPDRVAALHYIASTYESIGDYALADTHYRQLLARQPGNVAAQEALVRLRRSLNSKR